MSIPFSTIIICLTIISIALFIQKSFRDYLSLKESELHQRKYEVDISIEKDREQARKSQASPELKEELEEIKTKLSGLEMVNGFKKRQ